MAYTGPVNSKAAKSGASTDACHVHGSLPSGVFPGEKTLHDMQPSIFSSSIPYMLQRSRKLPFLVFCL